MKILKGNIVQCKCCRSFIEYEKSDVKEVERDYGVGTYQGETYFAKVINCPNCNTEIEIY